MHRCAGELVTSSEHFSLMDLSPAESPQDAMVQVSPHQAVLTGPGRLRLIADVPPVAEVRQPVNVLLRVGIIELERPVTIEIALTPRNPGQDKRWVHRGNRER
jgi:hypothetical protein